MKFKKIPFTLAPKNTKYLDTNLTKYIEDSGEKTAKLCKIKELSQWRA